MMSLVTIFKSTEKFVVNNFDINIDFMQFLGVEEESQANGIPLLKINGQNMEHPVFNRLKRELDASTICFNFPPIWVPSWLWLMSPMTDIAHKVTRLIDALGHKQVDVLGISWGGALAIELASIFSKRVRKLVLVSTTARPHLLLDPTTLSAYFTKNYGGKVRNNRSLQTHIEANAGSSPFTTNFYRGVALPYWIGMSRLPLIRQKTLIINGSDDKITPPSESRFMERWIQNSRSVEVDDGHLAVHSSAHVVAGHVNEFLSAE